MKVFLYISLMFIAFACKKDMAKTAKIITDCTGTYLNWNGKDYKVYNLEKVSSFPNGSTVTVTFKKIPECKGLGNFPVTCYMNHEYDSWIEVETIK